MKKAAAKRRSKVPSKAAIRRAVASSTAIETGEPIDRIEQRLRAGNSKFRHLALAE